MPHRYSNTSNESDHRKENATRRPRTQSASEIARNVTSFETWATYQGCEEVAYDDIPPDILSAVQEVFSVYGRLPSKWADKSSEEYEPLKKLISKDLLKFVSEAHEGLPELFSPSIPDKACRELLGDVQCVFAAWSRLQKMRKPDKKWSEADYAANVYNVFRSPAARESDYRAQCSISLAQPLPCFTVTKKAVRTLNAKSASPDTALFIPAKLIRELSHSARSPFKVLRTHPAAQARSVAGESSFRYQATPCAKLQDTPGFEFASTFWEDKKPVHHMLEDAYRQNRMATTSAVRQLHALRVDAPVFGLVWAQGTVRAHIDWWIVKPNADCPSIQSAAYPGPNYAGRRASGIFYEWHLDDPSDILQVYLIVKNLDHWTVNGFTKRVIDGVKQLQNDVVNNGHTFVPWRRKGDLGRAVTPNVPRNPRPSVTISETLAESPPRRKPATRSRR